MDIKTEWIYCPICGKKTHNKIREDTGLKTFLSTARNVGRNILLMQRIYRQPYQEAGHIIYRADELVSNRSLPALFFA